jgi:hypothetical protein
MVTIDVKPMPRKPLTQRQKLSRAFGISDRQLTRWVRFIEENSLDWNRCNAGRERTPRYLHPFQEWLLTQVLAHRHAGRDWLEPVLLHSSQWTLQTWEKINATTP